MEAKSDFSVKTAIPRPAVPSMNIPRSEVYSAVDTEVEFAQSFVAPERQYYETHTLGEFVLMLNQYAAQAMQKWTHHSDGDSPDEFPPSLHEVRKIAALAVRCMIQHGAPRRINLHATNPDGKQGDGAETTPESE